MHAHTPICAHADFFSLAAALPMRQQFFCQSLIHQMHIHIHIHEPNSGCESYSGSDPVGLSELGMRGNLK